MSLLWWQSAYVSTSLLKSMLSFFFKPPLSVCARRSLQECGIIFIWQVSKHKNTPFNLAELHWRLKMTFSRHRYYGECMYNVAVSQYLEKCSKWEIPQGNIFVHFFSQRHNLLEIQFCLKRLYSMNLIEIKHKNDHTLKTSKGVCLP